MNIRIIFSILMVAQVVQVCGQYDDGDTMTVSEFKIQEARLLRERDRSHKLSEWGLGIILGTNLTLGAKALLQGAIAPTDGVLIGFLTATSLGAFYETSLAEKKLDTFRAAHPGMPEDKSRYKPGRHFFNGILVGAVLHSMIKVCSDADNLQPQDFAAPALVIVSTLRFKNMSKMS